MRNTGGPCRPEGPAPAPRKRIEPDRDFRLKRTYSCVDGPHRLGKRSLASPSERYVGSHNTTGLDLQIVDRRSSVPLTSVVINIVLDAKRLMTEHTDVHGRVSVDLPEGAYDVMILAGGYTSTLIRGVGVLEGHRVDLIRGLAPGNGKLEEKPAGAIGGVCVDRLSQPLMNIIVQANAEGLSYTVRSDRKGCYMLNGLPPAKYKVVWRTADRALMTADIDLLRPRQLVRKDVQLLYA